MGIIIYYDDVECGWVNDWELYVGKVVMFLMKD